MTSLQIDKEDLKKNYLSFKAIVCGEEWKVEHVKIRLGHKTIVNYFNRKDTFNKLGYKTKINTHTTSCINLFLDIYLYSEYRLIYC